MAIQPYNKDLYFGNAKAGTIMLNERGNPMVSDGNNSWSSADQALPALQAAMNQGAISKSDLPGYMKDNYNHFFSANHLSAMDEYNPEYANKLRNTNYNAGTSSPINNNANYVSATETWENPLKGPLAAPPKVHTVSVSRSNTGTSSPGGGTSTVGNNQVNQAPAQHQNYDFGKSLGYADRTTQTNSMGQAASIGDLLSYINKAANTLSNPTMQNGNLVGQLTGDILQNLNPVRQQQNAAINQQYNNSAQRLAEQLAASGANRGGNANRQMMGLEQGRNTALANANASLVQNALSQALPFGQLQLSERGLLQGQQQTAANQLASLLGQQEASRQWATGFNADQLQRQFANILAAQQAQAGENRFGSQLNQQESQFARQLAEQIAARQGQQGLQEAALFGEGQIPIDYSGMNTGQLAQAFSNLPANLMQAFNTSNDIEQYRRMMATGNEAGANNILRNWLKQNVPTQTKQTLAAQQLAQQISQQLFSNKITEADLLGIYNGQDTLGKQQLGLQGRQGVNQLIAGIIGDYARGTQNFTLPDWMLELFKSNVTGGN